jgi:hypothetical protein
MKNSMHSKNPKRKRKMPKGRASTGWNKFSLNFLNFAFDQSKAESPFGFELILLFICWAGNRREINRDSQPVEPRASLGNLGASGLPRVGGHCLTPARKAQKTEMPKRYSRGGAGGSIFKTT